MKKLLVLMCTIVFPLSFIPVAGAVPIQWSSNSHYYEAVFAPYLSWTSARAAAEAASYLGSNGHLATITSQEENDFIFNQLAIEEKPYWLGGFQTRDAVEPAGKWQWVNNEGFFWDDAPLLFANWSDGEPNNLTLDDEDALNFAFFDSVQTLDHKASGKWNDAPMGWTEYSDGGYVIEWDVAPVPEPATIVLLGSGLFSLALFRMKLRRRSEKNG